MSINTNVEVPISLGELIDKITILEIKQEQITDYTKKTNVKREASLLELKLLTLNLNGIQIYRDQLKYVNKKLWDIEDQIRLKEKDQIFDQEFIFLARQVYITNDQRFSIKNEINNQFSSSIKEIKSYENYESQKTA
jgi:hypothetical protein